ARWSRSRSRGAGAPGSPAPRCRGTCSSHRGPRSPRRGGAPPARPRAPAARCPAGNGRRGARRTGTGPRHPSASWIIRCMAERFDVVIIGGGLIGSSAAMHLAERGVRSIALLDVDLGGRYSSSELNAGGVRATWRNDMNIALSLASIEFFESVAAEIGFDQKGYLWLHDAASWPAAEEALALQTDRWRLGVRPMTPADVTAHCPLLDGLDGVVGATFSPKDGLLNPNLLKELYRARARARAGGGVVFKNYVFVTGIDVAADH